MVEKKNFFFNFSPINLYDSLVNQLKIEHFLPRLCSIVIIVQSPSQLNDYKAALSDVKLILHGVWISK